MKFIKCYYYSSKNLTELEAGNYLYLKPVKQLDNQTCYEIFINLNVFNRLKVASYDLTKDEYCFKKTATAIARRQTASFLPDEQVVFNNLRQFIKDAGFPAGFNASLNALFICDKLPLAKPLGNHDIYEWNESLSNNNSLPKP